MTMQSRLRRQPTPSCPFVFFVRFYCLYLGFWSFEFVSDFEFRISNFLVAASPRQGLCAQAFYPAWKKLSHPSCQALAAKKV